jgi:ATP-dependent DNA ligase
MVSNCFISSVLLGTNNIMPDSRELRKQKIRTGKISGRRLSDHVDEKEIELFELVEKHRVEGIVAKQKLSVYSPG